MESRTEPGHEPRHAQYTQPAPAARRATAMTVVSLAAALLFGAGSLAVAFALPSGALHLWAAEEDFVDSVGTNDGTPARGVGFAPGQVGHGFALDGVGDHVEIDRGTFDGLQDLTVAAWIRADSLDRGRQTIVSGHRSGNEHYWTMWVEGDRLEVVRLNCLVRSDVALTPGVFHHVAATRAGSTITLYIDGQDGGSSVVRFPGHCGLPIPTNFSGTASIGATDPLTIPSAPFGGIIDEVVIFERALTAAEIAGLYEEGLGAGTLVVLIDIKPGSDPNSVNPRSNGSIPVAILSSLDFDATSVDAATVRLGDAEPRHARRAPLGHLEDVDGDGDTDMVLHFRTRNTGISCGETELTLTGETLAGASIEGSDAVRTVGCR